MSDTQRFIDPSDLRKYRHELPNIVDDMDLSPHAYRLYGHIKRRCGASDGGECYEGVRGMAEHCKMSLGMVVRAKQELEAAGLVKIKPGDPKTSTPDTIIIIDIWRQNFMQYQTRSLYEHPVHNMNTPVHGDAPPRSPNEQPRSQYERKNEPPEERTNEEIHARFAGARGPTFQRGSPPEPIVPEAASPTELPPTVEHFALKAHWDIYRVGIDIDTQTRVAAVVTDPALWTQALNFWVDNDYRGRSIGKIVKKYRELEAEQNGKTGNGRDTERPARNGIVRTNVPNVSARSERQNRNAAALITGAADRLARAQGGVRGGGEPPDS
jgi:hypothetical protein